MNQTAQNIIDRFHLKPHPEGGYFREIYRSEQTLKSPVHALNRNAVTEIYFLLDTDQISRFHKVVHDEIWHFYEGAPLRLIQYNMQSLHEIMLGPNYNTYVCVVPGGVYQAAASSGNYSLVGCTVAPGFDFKDFTFLQEDQKAATGLVNAYPAYQRFV